MIKSIQPYSKSTPVKLTIVSAMLVFLLAISVAMAYELIQEFFLPEFQLWQRRISNIIITTLCGAVIAFVVSRRYDSLYQQLIREIDERRKTQEELQRHQEQLKELVLERTQDLEAKTVELERANVNLQSANRHKSVFLASMSHELRTPLNSIIGFTGIMLKGMAGELTDEQKKQLTMVKSSAMHLLSLINDVLDVSKIEAGKIDVSREEFRLDRMLTEVVQSIAPAAEAKGLELLTYVPENITIFSDQMRVKQVLLNLCCNAVKFTEQGTVEVAAKVLNRETVEISVTDTGIGIKEKDIGELFEPFQQVGMSMTKRKEGTGLGLYLTKKLVTLLGGEVWAKSYYGRGSEFTVLLPGKLLRGERNEKSLVG